MIIKIVIVVLLIIAGIIVGLLARNEKADKGGDAKP